MPRILLNINEVYVTEKENFCQNTYNRRYVEPNFIVIAKSIEQILLIFNSSINFVYYCLVGKTFRQHMCRAIFWWCNSCIRVMTGGAYDLTTTAGTGETTVPDGESRMDRGASCSGAGSRRARIRHASSEWVSGIDEMRGDEGELMRKLEALEEEDSENSRKLSSQEHSSSNNIQNNCLTTDAQVEPNVTSSSDSSNGYYDINIQIGILGDQKEPDQCHVENEQKLCVVSQGSGSSRKPKKFSAAMAFVSPTGSYCELQNQPVFV